MNEDFPQTESPITGAIDTPEAATEKVSREVAIENLGKGLYQDENGRWQLDNLVFRVTGEIDRNVHGQLVDGAVVIDLDDLPPVI